MGKRYVAYVGSYTFIGKSKGITIYDVDVEAGRFTRRDEVEINNSSYLAVSHSRKYLYSVVILSGMNRYQQMLLSRNSAV